MVGGWNKKDNGASAISSTNIFTALESRRKKANGKVADIEKQNFKSSPSPLSTVAQARVPTLVSWADWEEGDDEIFAMSALQPLPSLDDERAQVAEEKEADEESYDEVESSHEDESEGCDEVEEGNEENKESDSYEANKLGTDANTRMATKEPDRQLSKKELKKKELAELEAALVELGLNQKSENGD
ncbi:hypothetical protein L7F22_046421 [Adiantum nelumboides]|nr:hypothetical protein [Adiantum nelumboides]